RVIERSDLAGIARERVALRHRGRWYGIRRCRGSRRTKETGPRPARHARARGRYRWDVPHTLDTAGRYNYRSRGAHRALATLRKKLMIRIVVVDDHLILIQGIKKL